MITYVTGDLLKSDAECLVNTVNCEGYMGKGIAYQFKLSYPNNNKDYVKACKSGELHVGKLHYFKENGKIIINFPTKDKWRANSKIEYIQDGLDELILLIDRLSINSIAIPPLGSGNGGLIWADVKPLLTKKLSPISDNVEIFIYEPSKNYVAKATVEPKLSFSALVLMLIKLNLNRFDKLRLQKTAYFIDIFNEPKYFHFKKHNFGPYDHSIDVISKSIKEFQQFHNVNSTAEAYEIAYRKLASESVDNKLNKFIPIIKFASSYVNKIDSDHELECLATILFLIEKNNSLSERTIVSEFKAWSEDKMNRFSEKEILRGIKYLYDTEIIDKSLIGYFISDKLKTNILYNDDRLSHFENESGRCQNASNRRMK